MRRKFLVVAIIAFILSFIMLCGIAFAGFAITLEWDPSPSSDVAGYKIYYKSGSTGPPYDGTGILEGISPIDVGNVLTISLSGLSETQEYYFTATAYDSIGRESDFSNEVSSVRPQPPENLIKQNIRKIVKMLRHCLDILEERKT